MLITNATLLTLDPENRILEDQAIYLENGKIAAIGPEKALRAWYPEAEALDARGQYVMPGNVCAHTHFYGAFARGMAIPGPAPKDFPEILQKLWWPLDKALDPDAIRLSAQVLLADAIRHGTTTVIDHHASPNAIDGSLDVIAHAVQQSGLRAVLCYEVTDRDGPERARAGIEENVRFIQQTNTTNQQTPSKIAATFGLHAGLTLSDATLDACRNAAPEGTGFHVHVAEHESDEYDSLEKSGLRAVDRLHKHGLLGPRTILAHCVHVDAAEIGLIADTDTWVSHQARSNMNNGVGVTPVESLLRAGVRVCLGTDGFPHAMWEETRFAYMIQKLHHRDPRRMPGNVLFDMLVGNNPALAGSFFPDAPLGILAEGAHADLIFVDYHPFTPLTPGNLPWHVIFGFHESMVTTTICGGQVLMRDRQLLTLDEAALAAEARDLAPKVWGRYEKYALKA
ncbi:MAG: putative aminohydrolase SsnA [Anaerolineales bacterium]|nr:putative aminohydrolase SsnA [Anaerolineales bacterium]